MATKVPTVKPRDTRRSGPKYAGSSMQKPRKWTSYEDELLRLAVEELGAKHWKAIAERVPGRNHVQCLQRYLRVLQPGLKKGHWTPEEDEKLRSLATRGFTSWTEAAEQIPGRSAKQCRDRWRNHLETNIKHGAWEPEEDALLLQLHEKHGNRWAAIARCIPGRTENAVKIHCKSLLSKKFAVNDNGEAINIFESQFDIQQSDEEASDVEVEDQEIISNSNKKMKQELEEDPEETADDLSSISPLPSPMGFSNQWMRGPWVSPTNASAAARGSQFSLPNGYALPQHQSQQQNVGSNAVLRATRLQSFPAPMLATNLVMRRSSFPSQPQVSTQSSSQSSHGHSVAASRKHLFPPLDTSASMLYDHSALDHLTSPIHSPTNAAYIPSPTNFNGAVPLNYRLELPTIIRPSNEAVGDRFFVHQGGEH